MRKKRAYRLKDVKDVDAKSVLRCSGRARVTVGVDVGKFELVVIVRWAARTFFLPCPA